MLTSLSVLFAEGVAGQSGYYYWLGTPITYYPTYPLDGYIGSRIIYPDWLSPSIPVFGPNIYFRGFLESPAYDLTGVVVDQNGNGLAGVRIVSFSSEGGSFSIATNSFGSYRFDLPTGFYTVTAWLPGYTFNQYNIRIISGIPSAAPVITGYPSFQY
ncbi:MAG: carboxypeptidase-like regulatory domain-containing protein [Methanotrichaceae archaeon]